MKKSILLIGLLSSVAVAQQATDYSSKVDSLLQLMTIEDKIGQTVQFSGGWDVTGPTVSDVNEDLVKSGQIGSFFEFSDGKGDQGYSKISYRGISFRYPSLDWL